MKFRILGYNEKTNDLPNHNITSMLSLGLWSNNVVINQICLWWPYFTLYSLYFTASFVETKANIETKF
jgi:hypothetical protein